MKNFFVRLRDRTRWSWQGIVATYKDEYSFRVWIWANVISVALVILLPVGDGLRALILVLGILVLVAELFNTAIERAVDHTSTEHNVLAGQAKDAASAAVALTRANGSEELREGLKRALPNHTPNHIDALTNLLSAAFDRAALEIVYGGDPVAYKEAMYQLVGEVLKGEAH